MHGFSLSRGLFWAAILFLLVLTAGPWLERLWISSQAEPRAVTARGELAGDERATIEIFESVSPSVVFITTTEELMSPWTRNLTEVRRGTGSGFVWDDDGHVVTNWHVIADAQSARVRLADQRSYPAELIGASPEHDLAVLRIGVALARPHPVPIGTSADLKVGQKVFAIGNPFGFDYSLTTGVVSALDRTIYADDGAEIRRLIQTDAAINPGNSGGPLIDSAGRLIGINTAIFSPSGSFSGIGFAVPADTPAEAKSVLVDAFKKAMATEKVKSWAKENYYLLSGKTGAESKAVFDALQSNFAWTLWDLKAATVDPASLGIPKP